MNTFFRRFCAGLIGLVFLFSGMVKLMDPVGTGLIVEAYMKFFHIAFLAPASVATGFALSLLEATCGIGLMSGVWKRLFALLSSVLIVFFTLVSLALFIENPEMECGCFGEFVHLSHAQTLAKNLILIVLGCCAFFPVRYLWPAHIDRYVSFALCELMVISFGVISLRYLPFMEFTEFSPSHTIILENQLVQSDEYPVLPVWDESGQDRSDAVLDGDVAVISIYNPQKISDRKRLEIASFAQDALNAGYQVVVLSAGDMSIPGVVTYLADYKKLITLNRSNGGVTFLNDGYIIRKASSYHFPSFEKMEKMLVSDATEMYISTASSRSIGLQGFTIAILAILLLV